MSSDPENQHDPEVFSTSVYLKSICLSGA
ncbi:mCG142406 [Mus musculus]|nr:mCG142406 [Mus musculus]